MGNSNQKINYLIQKKIFKHSGSNQYESQDEEVEILYSVVGCPKLVKSKNSGLQLEEYLVVSNPNLSITQDSSIYKLRSSSYSKNIAVVYEHKLVNEEEKLFRVRTEKMVCRLNQIDDLTCIEGLVIMQKALNGFIQLVHHCKVPFKVSDKKIGINQIGQLRVWGNQNFAVNGIQQSEVVPQIQMIASIEQCIRKHIHPDHQKNFGQTSEGVRKSQRLAQAKNSLHLPISILNIKLILYSIVERIKQKKQNATVSEAKNIQKFPHSKLTQENEKVIVKVQPQQYQIEGKKGYTPKYERNGKKVGYYQDYENKNQEFMKEQGQQLPREQIKSPTPETSNIAKKLLQKLKVNISDKISSNQNPQKNLEKVQKIQKQFEGQNFHKKIPYKNVQPHSIKQHRKNSLAYSQIVSREPHDNMSYKVQPANQTKLKMRYPHQVSHPNQLNLIKYSRSIDLQNQQRKGEEGFTGVKKSLGIQKDNQNIYQKQSAFRYEESEQPIPLVVGSSPPSYINSYQRFQLMGNYQNPSFRKQIPMINFTTNINYPPYHLQYNHPPPVTEPHRTGSFIKTYKNFDNSFQKRVPPHSNNIFPSNVNRTRDINHSFY